MHQLPRAGTAFQFRAFRGRRQDRRAGGDSPVQISSARLWFENFLADLLVREAAPVLRGQDWDFIAPVPLHPLKQREREFNQAEILARHLSGADKNSVEHKICSGVSHRP